MSFGAAEVLLEVLPRGEHRVRNFACFEFVLARMERSLGAQMSKTYAPKSGSRALKGLLGAPRSRICAPRGRAYAPRRQTCVWTSETYDAPKSGAYVLMSLPLKQMHR